MNRSFDAFLSIRFDCQFSSSELGDECEEVETTLMVINAVLIIREYHYNV